ncbi:hypothetical protein [Azospirillum ramasamyi]|uniref:Uncharacterized protein n=1 Tax=Azospirillum ramasamyi TaxID=682998 RepID=A0A2U9S7Q1_9PROT|nr:hypothetical protein [Azospirillum ramasamyi]AWU95585.1 hypothetical protein DM194_14880 [Azospirillum ramasamyi]
MSGLDTSAHRAGAGFLGFQKLDNEMGVFMQDDEGDLLLRPDAPLRQGSELSVPIGYSPERAAENSPG